MRNFSLKRFTASLLFIVMIVAALPASLFNFTVSAADTALDAAIFCSDLHGKTTNLVSILGHLKDSDVKYSSIGLVGDTCLTVSSVTSSISGALGYTPNVMFSYAKSHDTENGADIATNWNYSGEVENVSNYYLVYTIRETDMQNASDAATAAPAFTTWYNGLTAAEKTLPIFIMSHRPMHDRRDDNAGAATWYSAISAAAESSDIVFFWGHNHTGDNSVDQAAYYVAKDGTETMTIYNGSTVTPNFTYMNAGYIDANGQNPARKPVATTVQIYADKLVFQDYTTSGTYSGSYAHNVTVEREFSTKITPTTLAVTGVIEYTVGDALRVPSEVVVTYSDGSTKELNASDLNLLITTEDGADLEDGKFTQDGTYKLTYSYTENGQTATAVLTVTVKVGMATVTDEAYVGDSDFGYYVEATALGLTGMTATYVYEEYESVFGDTFLDYLAFDIALEGHTEGDTVSYYLELDEFISLQNLCLYYVDENNQLTAIPYQLVEQESGVTYLKFTADHDGVFLYGNVTVPDGYELSHITVDYEGATKYLVGDSFDMVNILVNAVYTKDGAEDFVCQIYAKGYAVEDGYEYTAPDMTTVGIKTVTVTYGGNSASFNIEIYNKIFPDANTGVCVEVTVPGATEIKVETVTSSNGTVTAAVGHLLNNYVAYDIELVGYNDGEKVTVTLPVPQGVENPVVYYVSDDGKTIQNMGATKNDDGTVSFETDHFSKYVVGESTEIEVPDPITATVTGSATTKKTVYVLSSSISSGNSYLIVNGNSAGTGYYALKNNSGSVDATDVEIKTDSTIGTYIELEDATDELWTVGGSYTFVNDGSYLGYTTSGWSSSFGLSTTARTWSYSNNRLSISVGSWSTTTYYLRYNSGWTWTSSTSASGRSVYFYVLTEIDVATSVNGTYSIEGTPAEVTKVVVNGSTATLGSTLTFTPESGNATTTENPTGVTYTVVEGGDPNGIISSISDNTVTFTGAYGKALVKVSYTGTAAGETYTVDNYIVITASAPYYEVSIKNGEKDVTGTTVSLKGITNGQTIALSALVNMITSDSSTAVEGATLEWHIPEAYQNIATIDHDTGLLTLKGVDGAFYITATYTKDGKDYTAGVNFSVTTTQYSNPSDGTEDFPEYPNEGAIRFDKTATAVGNFSETGIVQVELSMTGVPYTEGSEIDVVLMLDMTGSMSDTAMVAAEEAAVAFVAQIVKNKDGSYNKNRIAVYAFNSGSSSPYELVALKTINSDDELTAANTAIRTASTKQASGGTPYDEALETCQSVLNEAKTTNLPEGVESAEDYERQQFCVFMSDGGPTSYKYITNYDAVKAGTATAYTTSSASATGGSNQSDSNFATIATYTHEYYSTLMKDDGVTMFSVLTGLSKTSYPNCATILENIASSSDNAYVVESGSDTSAVTSALSSIAQKILQAATDVTVEDKITDAYTMIFDIPTGSKEITGVTNDFYIEFLKYTLDANHERIDDIGTSITKLYLKNTSGVLSAASDGDGTAYAAPVFENKTIGDKGTLYYWTTDADYASKAAVTYTANGSTYYFYPYGIKATDEDYDATKWFNMTSGAYATGTVDSATNMCENLVIATPYFVYNAANKMLYWTVDKIDTAEYALRYFLYLERSATEVGTENEIDPGSYKTNEYAFLTYTNFNGNECRQEMPVPQQTWSGAQVSYVFYLVNAQGQPINKSGQVVDFANATFITDLYTEKTVWNKGEDGQITADSKLSVDWLADNLLPSDYMVYDLNAKYQLHVYGDHTGASIFDYFTIAGSTVAEISASLNSRLEGANTTVSSVSAITTKVYNTKAGQKITGYGTYTSEATTSIDNEKVLPNFDFYNTTVAFAVVWQPRLVEDTVVVDFGLDVIINVVKNDILQTTITGIGLSNSAYDNSNVAMNTGVSTTSKLGTDKLTTIDGDTISIENGTSIRFHQGDMIFNAPVVFYYETSVEFWEGSDAKEGFMYSKVTIIPATNIYYEENFVTFTNAKALDENGNIVKDSEDKDTYVTSGVGAWVDEGTKVEGVQDEDRPGNNITSIDHNNVYGYDPAYKSYKMFSLGTAKMVSVNSAVGNHRNNSPTASFTFTGTGFDIISMTNSDSGVIFITATKRDTQESTNKFVDNYYGYTYTEANGWTPAPDPNAAIYQVPVMKISDLDYGTYDVKIWVTYNEHFDHDSTEGYSFWLDSIRIYDPAGTDFGDDSVIGDAYDKDGESNPSYLVIGDAILPADSDFTKALPGAVFIDGKGKTDSAADYAGPGPNNEIYLYPGQAIAFKLSSEATPLDVQIGVKLAFGDSADVVFAFSANSTNIRKITTATDMYYSIGSYLNLDSDDQQSETAIEWNPDDSITVMNNSTTGAVISLTNIKATFKMASYGDNAADINGEPGTPATITLITDAEVIEDAAAVVTKFFAFKPVVKPVLEVFDPETLAYTVVSGIRGINTVRVITSNDADAITVNGIEATKTDDSKIIKSMVKMLDKLYGDKHNAEDYCVWTVEVKSAPVYDIVAFQIVEIPDTSIDAPVAFEPETVAHTVISNINGTNTVRVITSKDVSSIIVNGVKAEKINDAKILKSMVKMLDKLYDDKHNESDYYVWTVDVKSAASYDIVAFNEDGVSTIPAIENTKNVSNK